jgi:hypothetical protein
MSAFAGGPTRTGHTLQWQSRRFSDERLDSFIGLASNSLCLVSKIYFSASFCTQCAALG